MRRLTLLLLLPAALLPAACQAKKPRPRLEEADYTLALPPGQLGLVPLPAGEPAPDVSIGWHNRERLALAIQYSLDYLSKPSSRKFFPYGPVTHERMRDSLYRFQELLLESASSEEFRAAVMAEFEIWMARGRENSGEVLFTGYCRPILNGSLTQQGPYRYPLYSLPADLVKGEDGEILGRRAEDGSLVPYYTSAELRAGAQLAGLELVWLDDPFEAYIAQVQGSALIRLPDGSFMEAGYAGKNGHDYESIGLILIDEGKIPKDRLSLSTLQEFFRDHPEELEPMLARNPSFVFFQLINGGPYGSLGVPVTDARSLATDKAVFPRAALSYCEVRLPAFTTGGELVQRPQRFFALDQDRGGAIRSAGRCDVFLGTGDRALARSGHVLSLGRMYYLFLKPGPLPRTTS